MKVQKWTSVNYAHENDTAHCTGCGNTWPVSENNPLYNFGRYELCFSCFATYLDSQEISEREVIYDN